MLNKYIESLIELALEEDVGDGDHTSLACIPEHTNGKAHLMVKEAGIIAGIEIAERIFQRLDSGVSFIKKIDDGSKIVPGDVAFQVSGKVISLLQAERLVLNIMQRMSGC